MAGEFPNQFAANAIVCFLGYECMRVLMQCGRDVPLVYSSTTALLNKHYLNAYFLVRLLREIDRPFANKVYKLLYGHESSSYLLILVSFNFHS